MWILGKRVVQMWTVCEQSIIFCKLEKSRLYVT
jgi:hypothetical protein